MGKDTVSKSESKVQDDISVYGRHRECILMRNNSGALRAEDGRPVRFGLGNVSKKHNDVMKSSDLIGITTITITAAMVGKQIGVFTAIEAKKENWKRSPTDKKEIAQDNFIKWVKIRGGLAGFANSVDSFIKLLQH